MKTENQLKLEYKSKVYRSDINNVVDLCHGLAKDSGWHTDLTTGLPVQRNKFELIALIHSEVSEAVEGLRKDRFDDHLTHRKMEEVELADAVIRIMDYCGLYNLDLGGALVEKLQYNQQRADHKLENRVLDGGKKY